MKKLKIIKRQFKEWKPSTYATILLLITPLLFFSIKKFTLDNDFWFLTNTGKYILKHGFITIEPFTIHNGLYFIPQQWLTTIIFHLIYHNFGTMGILMLELVINVVIIYLIYSISSLISNNKKKSIFMTIIIDILMIISETITSRPQIFDIVLFLLLILLLEKYIKENNKKYLFFIPIISILMINLHASIWLMLFVFLIPYYIEYIVKRIKHEKSFKIKPLIITTIGSLICGLINPYHIHSMTYLFKSFGIKEINNVVGEMKAASIISNPIIYIIICIGLLYLYKNKGNNKIRYVLLFLGTTYLTLSHVRGVLFLLISTILILSQGTEIKNQKEKTLKVSKKEKIIYIVSTVMLITFSISNIKIDRKNKLQEVVDYLNENTSHSIKLYTEYDYGDYFEYRGYKSYIDARAEVFLKSNNKKEDIFIEYYNIIIGKTDTKKFLDKYKFDYLVVFYNNYFMIKELNDNKEYEKIKYTNSNEKDLPSLYKRKTK